MCVLSLKIILSNDHNFFLDGNVDDLHSQFNYIDIDIEIYIER